MSRRFLRLVVPAWARAFALTNLGGLALLALAVATEAAGTSWPALLLRFRTEVPHTWALLSPALALVAAAIAVHRIVTTGELLALGTLGVSRLRVLLSVAWIAVPVAAIAAGVGRFTDPAVAVARAPGAWLVSGAVLPDPGAPAPSAAVIHAVRWGNPLDWPGTGAFLVCGALAGAALGLRGGGRGVLVAAAAWLVGDLVRRGAEPLAGGFLVAGVALVAAGLVWREGR